jgi:hypothetical protein
MPSTRAGVPKPPGTSLVAGGWTYLENPLYDNRLCAQGTNVSGRRADGRREKSNQTEITGYQRSEPIRIDRASTETLAVDSCSVHQLPPSPARTPRNFHYACGGGGFVRGRDRPARSWGRRPAVRSPRSVRPAPGRRQRSCVRLNKTTFDCPINLTFPFGCIICKTKPKYSNSSMG